MNTTNEAFAQAVASLRAWLDFLETKEREYQEQLERARRKPDAEEEPAAAEPSAQGEAEAGDAPAWL